jgi:predicted secreted protein
MKNPQLFLILLGLVVILACVPVNASGSTTLFPATQWKDTTSLVRGYTGTTSPYVTAPGFTYTTVSIPTPTYAGTTSPYVTAPGFTYPAVSIPTPTYTGNDNGRTFSLARNAVVKVQLDENPTTGYSWNITESSGIQVLSSSFLPSAPGRFGAGGIHTWVIKVTGTGTQEFRGVYKQPWIPASKDDSTYILSFTVR